MKVKACLWIAIAIVAQVFAWTAPASALTCTATVTMNFGTVNLTTGAAVSGTGNVQIDCIGGLQGDVAHTCVGIAPTKQMSNGLGGLVNFEAYSDGGHGSVWGSIGGSPTPPMIDVTLGLGGIGSLTTNIYGSILGSQQTAPTNNANSLYTGTPSVTVASDVGNFANCGAVGSTNQTAGTSTFTATYLPACTLSANTLNFGTLATTDGGSNGATSINTTCSALTPYTVWLGGGLLNIANPAARQMQSGANRLTYGIYRDSNRTLDWGSTPGVDVFSDSGLGGLVSTQVYGRVQSQATPPPGTYTDTVVVTINY